MKLLSLSDFFWSLSKMLTFVCKLSKFKFIGVINFVELTVDFTIFSGDISWSTLVVEGFFIGKFKVEEFEIETAVVGVVKK